MKSKVTGRTIIPLLQRLIDNIKINRRGCWEWQKARNKGGYGELFDSVKGAKVLAHRYFYSQYIGKEIPEGLDVLHSCDNPCCVYPKHLFLGTDQNNADDKVSKGRQSRRQGENNHTAKLTPDDIRAIRLEYIPMKTSYAHLAERYSVTPENISAIVNRRTWKHI